MSDLLTFSPPPLHADAQVQFGLPDEKLLEVGLPYEL